MATDWAPAPALENERSPETLERVPGKIVDAWTTDEGARGGAIAEAPRGGAKTEEAPQVNNERARWRAPPEREGPRDNKASSECNLCSSSAVEPVVTRCGHLYCWSCVYSWLQEHKDAPRCPVCECGISETSVVPLYAHGREESERRSSDGGWRGGSGVATATASAASHLPMRPRGVRVQPRRRHSRFDVIPEDRDYVWFAQPLGVDDATREEQQQAFLQRLLLFVGLIVILCIIYNT